MLESALAAAVAFAATNVDDLLLLTAWFALAGRGMRATQIVAGQFLGFTALVAISLAGFAGGMLVPREWIGLLGLLPIALGVRAFLRRDVPGAGESAPGTSAWSVAAVTIANGGDNIGIYVPLFAASDAMRLGVTLLVFYLLLAGWCGLGWRMARQPAVAAAFARHGNRIVPFALVGLGAYLVVQGGSWRLLSP